MEANLKWKVYRAIMRNCAKILLQTRKKKKLKTVKNFSFLFRSNFYFSPRHLILKYL